MLIAWFGWVWLDYLGFMLISLACILCFLEVRTADFVSWGSGICVFFRGFYYHFRKIRATICQNRTDAKSSTTTVTWRKSAQETILTKKTTWNRPVFVPIQRYGCDVWRVQCQHRSCWLINGYPAWVRGAQTEASHSQLMSASPVLSQQLQLFLSRMNKNKSSVCSIRIIESVLVYPVNPQ